MKKVYKKPIAYIENFEMSQHIANCYDVLEKKHAIREGCTTVWNDKDSSDDQIEHDFFTGLFYTSLDGSKCFSNGEDFYCYTEGTGPIAIFTS